MIGKFTQFISDNELIARNIKVLLAVSGGLDSVVMADLFHQTGYTFAIAHVNFNLRGSESDRDEQFVRQLADLYKVDFFVKHFDTKKYARQHKISIQVAAREQRYQWFDELLIKKGYDVIATAHHQDDQVETFLINLSRGTGIAGLHGIPVQQGRVIRPMLFASRNEIAAYASENNLQFVEDSSNSSLKYTRNRIRHKIIPQIEKINPAFRQALLETITNIREAEQIFKQAVEEKRNIVLEVRNEAVYISTERFFSLKPMRTWAFELLSPFGFNSASLESILEMENAIPGKELYSETHRLVKDRDCLIIVPRHRKPEAEEYEITAGDMEHDTLVPVHLSFEIIDNFRAELKQPPGIALIDPEKLVFPLRLRKWKRGDVFVPYGMSKFKKLSDFFIDLKYSRIDKENQWLLCSGTDIVWVIGRRLDDRYKVSGESLKILKITVSPTYSR